MSGQPPRRLRLAVMVEHINRRGGQERVAAELVSRLCSRHEVHVYSYQAEGLPAEVTVHHLPTLLRSSTANALAYVLLSRRALRGQSYDVILGQGGNCLAANFVLVHICQEERRRSLAAFPPQSLSEALWRRLFGLRLRLTSALERRALRRCSGRAMAVSPALARALCEVHGLPPGSVVAMPNGVDQEQFRPEIRRALRPEVRAELGLQPEEFVALFVGGRWTEKGLPLTLAGVARMQQPCRLLIAGQGDEPVFQRLAESLGLGERVRFLGVQPHIERTYAAADALVFTPPAEGFGLVMAEAAACGLPLVATRAGIAEYLIEPGDSGFLVGSEPAEIAAALDALAADPAARERMGQAAHERARDLTWDRQAQAIEQFLLDGTAEMAGRTP